MIPWLVSWALSLGVPTARAQPEESSGPANQVLKLQEVFPPGGLRLAEAVTAAVASSPTVDRAAASVIVARANARMARIALFPRIDLYGEYRRLSPVTLPTFGIPLSQAEIDGARALVQNVTDPSAQVLLDQLVEQSIASSQASFPQFFDTFVFSADVSFPVSDFFLRSRPALRAVRAFAEAETIQSRVEAQNVALQAVETYYECSRAQTSVWMAKLAQQQVHSHLEQIRALAAAGAVPVLEQQRVESQYQNATLVVDQTMAGEQTARLALSVLLDRPTDALAQLTPHLHGVTELRPKKAQGLSDVQLQKLAMQQRDEIASLNKLVEGRRDFIRVRSAQRYPVLEASGGVDIANPNQRFFPQTNEFRTTWDVGAGLRWSPNDAMNAGVELDTARAELIQAEADLRAMEQAVRLELNQASLQYSQGQLAERSAQERVEMAARNLADVQHRAEAGTVTAPDLMDAKVDLARAEFDRHNAHIDMAIARTRFLRALGEPLVQQTE